LKLDTPVNSPVAPASLDDVGFADYVSRFKGSRKELAAALGMSERSLYRRLKQLGSDGALYE
jgi:DNA-binding NtrC family response regulator